MSLFSSPAFRIFNAENSKSIQKKPGNNALQTRKPFVDRSVNCNTPNVNRKQKFEAPLKESAKKLSPKPLLGELEDLEISQEYYFSYKTLDGYEDFHPKGLEDHHIDNIVKNYLNYNTPPPSPRQENEFSLLQFEIPKPTFSFDDSLYENDFSFDDKFDMMPSDILEPLPEITI